MRGHLIKRYKGSWTIVLDLGRQRDPLTGHLKRVQKWFAFRGEKGTKKEAEEHLNDLLHRFHQGGVLEPSKMLLSVWLDRWLDNLQ